LDELDLDECVSCGAGLLAVSDICPQCGCSKNKSIKSDEPEEKISDDNELDEVEEKITDDNELDELQEELDALKKQNKENHAKIKNKIFRPTSVRLLALLHVFIGISMIVFGIIFGSAVIFLVMSSGMGSLGDIGGGMGNMMMLPGMGGIDASMMSYLDTIIGLNAIAGSPSASDIEVMMDSAGILDIDLMMEIITETSVIALIEIALGVFLVMMGRGLFKGQKWARPVAIAFSIFSIPLVVLFIENVDNLVLLGMASFDGMLLYCMFKSNVKKYFNQPSIKKLNKKSKIKNSKTAKKS
jgi:hypothetical protein